MSVEKKILVKKNSDRKKFFVKRIWFNKNLGYKKHFRHNNLGKKLNKCSQDKCCMAKLSLGQCGPLKDVPRNLLFKLGQNQLR